VLRRPVSNLSFALTAHFLGVSAFDYKLVNLFIHLLNGLLAWALTTRVLRMLAPELTPSASQIMAVFTAAAWMLHPLQVSTVLYAVQRMSQLSALFLFAALFVSVGTLSKLHAKQRARHLIIPISVVIGLVALSIFSKENGALFPLMLMVILFCSPKTTRVAMANHRLTRHFVYTTVFVPLAIGASVAAFSFQKLTEGYASRDFILIERLLTQPFVIGHYIYSIAIPNINNMGLYLDDFPTRAPSDPLAWLALVTTIAFIATAAALRARTPILSFGMLWFFSAHVLESTFLPLEMAFEHRNHVALLGPTIILVFYADRILQRFSSNERIALAVIPILIFFGLTLQRAHQWSSNELFIKNEIVNHPNSLRALSHAASFAANNGDIKTATSYILKAQELAPESFWYNALSINLKCGGASTEIKWNQLVTIAKQHPNQFGIDSIMKFIVDLVVSHKCERVAPALIDRLLVDLQNATKNITNKQTTERLYILRYRMSTHNGDFATAEELLRSAVKINSTGIEALELYAYASLNANDIKKAVELTDKLERRINTSLRETLLYKVHDLRIAIGEARRLNLGRNNEVRQLIPFESKAINTAPEDCGMTQSGRNDCPALCVFTQNLLPVQPRRLAPDKLHTLRHRSTF